MHPVTVRLKKIIIIVINITQSHQSSANNISVYVFMCVYCVCLWGRESGRNGVCALST